MKVTIIDDNLLELVETGTNSKYKKYSRDKKFLDKLIFVLNLLKSTSITSDLRKFSFLHYEQLVKNGKSSVRIMNGKVERLIFKEYKDGIEIEVLELDQNHYGRKK